MDVCQHLQTFIGVFKAVAVSSRSNSLGNINRVFPQPFRYFTLSNSPLLIYPIRHRAQGVHADIIPPLQPYSSARTVMNHDRSTGVCTYVRRCARGKEEDTCTEETEITRGRRGRVTAREGKEVARRERKRVLWTWEWEHSHSSHDAWNYEGILLSSSLSLSFSFLFFSDIHPSSVVFAIPIRDFFSRLWVSAALSHSLPLGSLPLFLSSFSSAVGLSS